MSEKLDSVAIEYLEKRIDKLEDNLQRQIDGRFNSLEKNLLLQMDSCLTLRRGFNDRVIKLEAFKAKTIAIVSAALVVVGFWVSLK